MRKDMKKSKEKKKIKFGRDEGNSGAIIRWGKYLDKGIWFRSMKNRRNWVSWSINPPHYYRFGVIIIRI